MRHFGDYSRMLAGARGLFVLRHGMGGGRRPPFSGQSAAWIGRVKQNVLPWPIWLSAQIRPP